MDAGKRVASIVSEDITLKVMERIHPGVDEAAMQRDGVRTYLTAY